jgi:hypothetical protein
MNFRFSRGFGQWRAVQAIAVCCYSNTNSAKVLLEQQQQEPRGVCVHISDGMGGL